MRGVGATRLALYWAALLIVVVGLGVGLLEGGARAYMWARPQSLPVDPAGAEGVVAPGPVDLAAHHGRFGKAVLHPYIGYASSDRSLAPFYHDRDDYPRRSPERYEVAVLGGSVASQVVGARQVSLASALEARPALAGRAVRVTSFAMGGFKQPQQLLALVYALSKGAEFDLVVNLDGFNELALPVVENLPAGVHPAYPRSWQTLAASALTPDQLLLAGEIAQLDQRREEVRRVLRESALGASAFVRLLAHQGLRLDATRRVDLERRLEATAALRARAERTGALGAAVEYAGKEDLLPDLVTYWKHTSLLLHQLCSARGIDYLHLIQPNQYDAGSKPLSPEERRSFVDPRSWMGQAILAGYPMLRRAGTELVDLGVEFRDSTRLFADHPETLYLDVCCHYNHRGVQLVVEYIAGQVEELLAGRPAGRRSPAGGWEGFRASDGATGG